MVTCSLTAKTRMKVERLLAFGNSTHHNPINSHIYIKPLSGMFLAHLRAVKGAVRSMSPLKEVDHAKVYFAC
jgi:hypothetical protein